SLRFIFAHHLDIVIAWTEEPGVGNRHALREFFARTSFVTHRPVIAAIDAVDPAGEYPMVVGARRQRLDPMKDAILFRRPRRHAAAHPRRLPGRVFLARIPPDHA